LSKCGTIGDLTITSRGESVNDKISTVCPCAGFLALEVQDESIVRQTEKETGWNDQDGCEVFLETGHMGNNAIHFTLHGNDPHEGGRHSYEWRIDLEKLSDAQLQLHPGVVLSVDVAVVDKDADGSLSYVTWGKGLGQFQTAASRGDVVLVEGYDDVATITGRFTTEKGNKPFAGFTLAAFRGDEPAGRALTDADGMYRLLLLPGTYTLKPGPGQGIEPFEVSGLTAREGEQTTKDLTASAPGAIVGRVTSAKEEPYRGLVIQAYRGMQITQSGRTDEEGRYRIDRLLPGVYTLKPGPDQGTNPFAVSGLTVRAEEQTRANFAVEEIPYLVRLSFRVSPARMAEFTAVYEAQIGTLLHKYGLVPSSSEVAAPDRVFSRLFELQARSAVEEVQAALPGDSTWTAMLRELAAVSGRSGTDSLMTYHYELYSMPAGPGKMAAAGAGQVVQTGAGQVVPAGKGKLVFGGHWRTYDAMDGLASADVRALLLDREGRLWIGTYGGGLCRYDGESFTTYTTDDGLAHNWVRALLQDSNGHLWIGTDGGGLTRYDGEAFTTYTTDDKLPHNVVTTLLEDREGHVWIGTEGGGICRYDGEGFTTFTTGDGLAYNWVASMVQDREGIIWIGTEGKGVCSYDGERFTRYTTIDGLGHNWVDAILQDGEGNMWFGTLGGVSRYDGEGFTTLASEDGLAHNWVGALLQDRQGNLWIGTLGGGVSRYNGQGATGFTVQQRLADGWVMDLVQDEQGRLWIGTEGGLSTFK
jgi:streptogramin lyase